MNEYLGAVVAMIMGRKPKKSKEQIETEIEESNETHYLELKKKTEQEAEKHEMTVKEAIFNGIPLHNLTRKHCKELGLE